MHLETLTCRCGYPILVYLVKKKDSTGQIREDIVFMDGVSGNYEPTEECPGCHSGLDYNMLI
jgi:hypothetical protein